MIKCYPLFFDPYLHVIIFVRRKKNITEKDSGDI